MLSYDPPVERGPLVEKRWSRDEANAMFDVIIKHDMVILQIQASI